MILEVAASEFVDFEIGLIFNRAGGGGRGWKTKRRGFKKKKERGKNRNGSVHRYNSPIIARFLPPPPFPLFPFHQIREGSNYSDLLHN